MRFEIPQGFTDEVRFFRVLPLRSLLVLLIAAIPGVILFKLLFPFGIGIYVIIVWAMIELAVVASTIIPLQMERWKDGGGLTIERYLTKKLLRRRKKELYTKGYGQMKYEEEMHHDLYD